MKRQEELGEKIVETRKQLENLLKMESVESLGEENQLGVEGNVPQPIFQQLIEIDQEQCKIDQNYIHPEDHRSLKGLEIISNMRIVLYQKMQAAFLQCSAVEQQSYQLHLEHLLSLSNSMVKEGKELKQVIPDPLVGEIRQLMRETSEQVEAIARGS